MLVAAGQTWASDGNCVGVDPDLFFPKRGASTAEARAVCDGCSVRDECLSWALALPEKHGIWGGTTSRDRRAMRRAMREAETEVAEVPAA